MSKYDHIDDLADYIEKFDIPKKYWRKMSMLFNRIRDEVQGRKPEGYADRYRKDLQRLLFKVIKEGKLKEYRIRGNADNLVIRKGDIKKGMMVWFEDGRGRAKKLKVKHVMLSKNKKEEHYITNRGTFTPRHVVGY